MTGEGDPTADPPAVAASAACAACGEPLIGAYCHACGERRPQPEDESLAHFLREQFAEVTSADGRLWRSLRALAVPGKLTVEYVTGRRGLYLRPVRLFLIGNILFFLMLTLSGANSVFLGGADTFRTYSAFGRWADAELASGAGAAGVDQPAYDAAFSQHAETLSTTLIAALIPGLALALAAVLFWAGAASGVRHLVFATHFLAVAMLGSVGVALLLIPVQLGLHLLGLHGAAGTLGASLDPIIGLALSVYFVAAVRRAYATGWPTAVAASAAVLAAFSLVVLQAYQALLFVVTLWTVDVPA